MLEYRVRIIPDEEVTTEGVNKDVERIADRYKLSNDFLVVQTYNAQTGNNRTHVEWDIEADALRFCTIINAVDTIPYTGRIPQQASRHRMRARRFKK